MTYISGSSDFDRAFTNSHVTNKLRVTLHLEIVFYSVALMGQLSWLYNSSEYHDYIGKIKNKPKNNFI